MEIVTVTQWVSGAANWGDQYSTVSLRAGVVVIEAIRLSYYWISLFIIWTEGQYGLQSKLSIAIELKNGWMDG